MIVRMSILSLVAALLAGGCGGEDVVGECLSEGSYTATYQLRSGSDPFCPELPSEILSVTNGSLTETCDPDCDCEVVESGPPTCTGQLSQICDDGDTVSNLDCSFDIPNNGRFEGDCTIVLTGTVELTCGYLFVGQIN